MLGISTSWRSEICDSGVEIIEEILSLGFKAVELEYRITESMVKEVLPFVKGGRISVTSLHNIMPLPSYLPKKTADGEFVSLSSPDGAERKSAVAYTVRTLDWAQEFGAKAVVLHLGKVRMDGVTDLLWRAHDEGRIWSQEFQRVVQEKKEIRAALGKPLLHASCKSLRKLAKEAKKRGILLGIENRYFLHDFPNLEEFKTLFREFKGSPIRYWHDVGHATTQENLGLVGKGQLLENFGTLLAGVHLHGCTGYKDHYAPGSGEEDYGLLKKFLKPETLRVVETHHRATRDELMEGVEFLKERGIID